MDDRIFLQFYFKRVSNLHVAFVTLYALYVMLTTLFYVIFVLGSLGHIRLSILRKVGGTINSFMENSLLTVICEIYNICILVYYCLHITVLPDNTTLRRAMLVLHQKLCTKSYMTNEKEEEKKESIILD